MKTKEKAKEFSVDYTDLLQEVIEKPGVVAKCFSVFHDYSVNNQLLAYWQMILNDIPVSPINTFKKWNALDRRIKAGSKALYLWIPIGTYVNKKKDEVTGEEKITSIYTKYKYVNRWFAMSQTEGKDFNPEQATLPNFDFNKVYKELGIKLIPFEKVNGNVQGYARTATKELAINPIAQEPEMTILHEVAHIALKHCEVDYSANLKELEAEAVAYICGSILGLPEEQLAHSRAYCQNWFKEGKVPEKNGKNITRVAQLILDYGTGKKTAKDKEEV